MNQELLINMFYAAPELWYVLAVAAACLLVIILVLGIRILKLKQKNYFINRDRERYAETLFASKDGYFAFIYPDERVNDPRKTIRERCSRRLAVLLNLEHGTESTLEEIVASFYKDDAKKIVKYIAMLREDGTAFESDFTTKAENRKIRLFGCRINGTDGSIYCDMIWFRDVTEEKMKIAGLEEEKEGFFRRILQLEDMINNISYPVWLRDESLNIVMMNKKYEELLGGDKKSEWDSLELKNANGENASKNLALLAVAANKPKADKINVIINGQIKIFEATETPFYSELNMENIRTVGTLKDITEQEEIKLNLKFNQEAQLEMFGSLGSIAFAIFDTKGKMTFYNKSFKELWRMEDVVLASELGYAAFLDIVREKRLLPEVSNFINYKKDEMEDFNKLIEPKEELMHLPDGRTIRRVKAPYPTGGIIFAYEDVSDKLAGRRAYNSLVSIQKEVIEDLDDAVLIFDVNGSLNSYNNAYIEMWRADDALLAKAPNIFTIIDSQKIFFDHVDDWETLQNGIVKYMTNPITKSFILTRNDGVKIDVTSKVLSDGSIMVMNRIL